jgi:hypothetical protein
MVVLYSNDVIHKTFSNHQNAHHNFFSQKKLSQEEH